MSDAPLARLRALPNRTKWLVAAAVAIVLGLFFAFRARDSSSTQYFTAKVERGDIHDVVDVTATLSAVKTVLVGSQVSGTISQLNVDFNSPVHAGQVIALIDPSLFKGALQQATADLDGAKANLAAAEANLQKARATEVQTKDDYDRNVPLVEKEFVTQQALIASKANWEVAKASVSAAQAGVVQAQAQVSQKEAAVAVARTNLAYTVIHSPVDGVVVARNVDVGQTVAASLQAPTIFTIAQDLTKMQLYAKTDESDVGRVRVGQAVTFKVDAFPKETFHGVVSQIRMNATTVQNVVTYDAIIDFANPDLKLFPGMTAYVAVPVSSVQNVVKVPNTALRYRPALPAEEVQALYAKYGITGDSSTPNAASPGTDRAQQAMAAGIPPDARPRPAQPDYGVVWKRHADNSLEPVKLALGITDHASTQVIAVAQGQLQPGDEVITAATVGSGQSATVRR